MLKDQFLLIKTIFKKEFNLLFKSSLFYGLAFLITLLLSSTFSVSLLNFAQMISNSMVGFGLVSQQQQNIHYAVFLNHLSLVNLFFIFLTPALAMRLISEERKTHSFDLLLTSPITSAQIVIGKFLSLMLVCLIICLISYFYIYISGQIFELYWIPTLTALAGIYLVSLVYSSLSLFASSLTENMMMSFILGVVFNLLVWIIGGFSEFTDHIILKSALEQISLNLHLQAFIEGVLRINSFVFFVSFIFFFNFLAERLIESYRWRS